MYGSIVCTFAILNEERKGGGGGAHRSDKSKSLWVFGQKSLFKVLNFLSSKCTAYICLDLHIAPSKKVTLKVFLGG
jgi:hypothetical protein